MAKWRAAVQAESDPNDRAAAFTRPQGVLEVPLRTSLENVEKKMSEKAQKQGEKSAEMVSAKVDAAFTAATDAQELFAPILETLRWLENHAKETAGRDGALTCARMVRFWTLEIQREVDIIKHELAGAGAREELPF